MMMRQSWLCQWGQTSLRPPFKKKRGLGGYVWHLVLPTPGSTSPTLKVGDLQQHLSFSKAYSEVDPLERREVHVAHFLRVSHQGKKYLRILATSAPSESVHHRRRERNRLKSFSETTPSLQVDLADPESATFLAQAVVEVRPFNLVIFIQC